MTVVTVVTVLAALPGLDEVVWPDKTGLSSEEAILADCNALVEQGHAAWVDAQELLAGFSDDRRQRVSNPPLRITGPEAPSLRLALTPAEAATALGVRRDFFDQHVLPELRIVRRGRRRLVPVRELERWLDQNATHDTSGRAELMRAGDWIGGGSRSSVGRLRSGRAPPKRPRPWPQEASPDATRGYRLPSEASPSPPAARAATHAVAATARVTAPASPDIRRRSGAAATAKSIRKTFPTIERGEGLAAGRERRATQAHDAGTVTDDRAAGMGGMAVGALEGWVRTRSGDKYKPSALRGYERAMRLRVLPEIGGVRLTALTRVDLQDLADRWLAKGLNPSTSRNTLMPLRAVYRRALSPRRGLPQPHQPHRASQRCAAGGNGSRQSKQRR